MVKKIVLSIFLTLAILAFPIRFLGFAPPTEAIAKMIKGIVFIAILLLIISRERFHTKLELLKPISWKTYSYLLPVIILITAYIVYFRNTDLNDYTGTSNLLILTLGATFVAASAEEIVFRGYLFNLFRKYNYSLLRSLVLSSSLFSIVHIVNAFRFSDPWAIVNQMILAFAIGMLFGAIFAMTKNLLLVCIFHFIVNIPTSVKRITESIEGEIVLAPPTLTEEVLSTLFVLALTLPIFLLAFYYIRVVDKRPNRSNRHEELTRV